MTKPKRKEGYGSTERYALHLAGSGSILSYDEYTRLCARQGELRKQIADFNTTIHLSHIARNPTKRKQLEQQRDALLPAYNEIEETLRLAEQVRRETVKRRKAELDGSGITAILRSAQRIIESLHERLGDDAWGYEDRETCASLRQLAGAGSPLLEMVNQDVVARIQEDHASEVQEVRRAAGEAVSKLNSQLRELAQRRSVPATVLRELYEHRYEEIDPLRKDRGVTHRIHLTEADCVRIENALDTIEGENND